MTAESARQQKAKKDKTMATVKVSVNTFLPTISTILSVIGITEDVDDSKRYATTCNQTLYQSTSPQFLLTFHKPSKDHRETNF